MRLLDTHTLQLELFEGGPKAAYAILSHTWGPDEVGFHDLGRDHALSLAGWAKIEGACSVARKEGYQYIWIDTCCIDKTSSAELSEAINSMWKWYADAEVCYAYLADVPSEGFNAAGPDLSTPLEKARWFTRGWTLQELLAPAEVVLFSRDWRQIGTKESLAAVIADITGVDVELLQMKRSVGSYSIAQRMSWAAGRRSTRLEDESYCLIGLFSRAFKRLQLEIMKETYDLTLLAWGSVDSTMTMTGVLALSPEAFNGCNDITWSQEASMRSNVAGEPKVSHDVIGSSLKMDAHTISVDMMKLSIQAHTGDANPPSLDRSPITPSADTLLHNITHFPQQGSYTDDTSRFDYSYLRSKGHDVCMVMLYGCQKGGKRTVGITLCSHRDGSLRRIHYPTRFLLPGDWTWSPMMKQKTLHLALSGSEVVAHSKPLFSLFRCLVRIIPPGPDVPYRLSHTIPEKASDALNCWYLDRWSDATDRATFSNEPGFALRGPGVGRALAFRHVSEPGRSFLVIFVFARFTKEGNRFLVGFAQGEDAMARTTQDDLQPVLPDPIKGPQFETEFSLDARWILSAKIRKGTGSDLVILSFRSTPLPA
ncbi:HET-domain-containing protein [Thozetella sp. PMI_491]|nr:HET-domain-containing protein [Thozetella sp. PMI_491]